MSTPDDAKSAAREGSLDAPVRHPLDWQSPAFYDRAEIEAEVRRVFDICHGCRRCFNLCDSFPRLFDLIDDSETGELDSVEASAFKPVVDACTLCDMCFMTKCPYVPPHEFNLDFPHLMLRYRAMEHKEKGSDFATRQLTETDRNGRLAAPVAPLANWASKEGNALTRPVMESLLKVHRDAHLPAYHGTTFQARTRKNPPAVNTEAPAYGRKAVIYATCFANYNNPDIGTAARAVLAKNGVETEVVYPGCCGMPQLEQGDLARVADHARRVAGEMRGWIDKGYDIVALVPSCALMLKFEWPLILPDDADVKALSGATRDVTQYVVDIANTEGLAEGLGGIDGKLAVHLACHARAQNMGAKAAELLRLIPEADIEVIERCSGHGGSWGIMKDNFETALKVGKPVARKATEASKSGARYVLSECPLARDHVVQGMERIEGGSAKSVEAMTHPIQVLARAYGL